MKAKKFVGLVIGIVIGVMTTRACLKHLRHDASVSQRLRTTECKRDDLAYEVNRLRASLPTEACAAPEGSTPQLTTIFHDSVANVERTVVMFARNVASPGPAYGVRICERGKAPVIVDAETAEQAFAVLQPQTPRRQMPALRIQRPPQFH